MPRVLFCLVFFCAALSAAEPTNACWGALETAAVGYGKDSSPEALDKLQTAIKTCAGSTGATLPESESKDTQVAAAWAACQNSTKALDAAAASGEAVPDAQKAFWTAFKGYLWSKAWFRLRESAKAYKLAKSPGAQADAAWLKKQQDRVNTRAESTNLDREAAAQSVILDWMTDYEKALAAKQPEAILEACRIFCWAHEQDIALPGLVLEGLQKDNRMTKFGKYLDGESGAQTAQAKKQETN